MKWLNFIPVISIFNLQTSIVIRQYIGTVLNSYICGDFLEQQSETTAILELSLCSVENRWKGRSEETQEEAITTARRRGEVAWTSVWT